MPTETSQSNLQVLRDSRATVSCTLLICLILDICMLFFGIFKKNDCTIDERIPLFLIVAGAVGIVSKVLPFVNYMVNLLCLNMLMSLLYFFEFVWMIFGSIWVYSIFEPNYTIAGSSYCDKTVYLFAFCIITIRWVLLIFFITCMCCFIVMEDMARKMNNS